MFTEGRRTDVTDDEHAGRPSDYFVKCGIENPVSRYDKCLKKKWRLYRKTEYNPSAMIYIFIWTDFVDFIFWGILLNFIYFLNAPRTLIWCRVNHYVYFWAIIHVTSPQVILMVLTDSSTRRWKMWAQIGLLLQCFLYFVNHKSIVSVAEMIWNWCLSIWENKPTR